MKHTVYRKLLFRLIFPHINDSITWCSLSQVCRVAREVGKSLLIKVKNDYNTPEERLKYNSTYHDIISYITKLPNGMTHGPRIFYQIFKGEKYLWEERYYVSGQEHGIRTEYYKKEEGLPDKIFAKVRYSRGRYVCGEKG